LPTSTPPLAPPFAPWARELAEREIGPTLPRRRLHDAAVDELAAAVAAILPEDERDLFLATLAIHDIGFSPAAAETGFQPIDGARYLEAAGAPERLVALIANNVSAAIEAELRGHDEAYERWPDEASALRDAVWFCCITTAADGSPIDVDERIDAWLGQYPEPVVPEFVRRAREPIRAAVARTAERLAVAGVATPGRVPSLGLDGQRNFRDVGGIPVGDGGAIRDGVLFRSGDLVNLTDGSRQRLAELGIATVLDLRGAGERVTNPSRWAEGAAPRTLEIDVDVAGLLGTSFGDVIADRTGAGVEDFMRRNYAGMPGFLAPAIGELASVLEGPETAPVLVHCTAGKDRTGVVIAVLLTALGAEREAVLADYLRSDRFYGTAEIAGYMVDVGAVDPGVELPLEVLAGFSSRPEYLESSFAAIESRWGSLEAYLEEAAGIDAARLERLRERLVELAPAAG
jgi:protein-tyrosine phosphatase